MTTKYGSRHPLPVQHVMQRWGYPRASPQVEVEERGASGIILMEASLIYPLALLNVWS
jgi:hypothetical protein